MTKARFARLVSWAVYIVYIAGVVFLAGLALLWLTGLAWLNFPRSLTLTLLGGCAIAGLPWLIDYTKRKLGRSF